MQHGPAQQPLRPPRQRVATAQPLAALPLTDAACPLRASGTRGRRNQWNTGDGNTGSAAARDSKRGAGQMRSCTPTTSVPAPRESTAKSLRPPAAPVGRSSQTRRHHLTPTPVQQLCTHVQSCDQSVFSLWTVPCAAVGGFAAYGCGVPLAGTARFSFGKA